MSQLPNGPFPNFTDPNENFRRLEELPLDERGYHPDVEGGYQPAQDGSPLDGFEMPTVNDTLDDDTGDQGAE